MPASGPATTEPTLAVRTTASPSGSDTVPVTWAEGPSPRVTVGAAATRIGAAFGAEVAVAKVASSPRVVPLGFTATTRKW